MLQLQEVEPLLRHAASSGSSSRLVTEGVPAAFAFYRRGNDDVYQLNGSGWSVRIIVPVHADTRLEIDGDQHGARGWFRCVRRSGYEVLI
jgi:hypothetical protein